MTARYMTRAASGATRAENYGGKKLPPHTQVIFILRQVNRKKEGKEEKESGEKENEGLTPSRARLHVGPSAG